MLASIESVEVSKERPLSPPVRVTLVSLAKVQAAALEVTVSTEASPKIVLPVEERLVKAPLPGVVPPIAPGAAQVLPRSVEALIVPVLVKLSEEPAPTTIAAVVLVAAVIPENGTEEAGITEVQVGEAPAPAELKNWPVVPAALFGIRAPEKRTLPVTSSFWEGAVLAMPTLPVESCKVRPVAQALRPDL